MRIRGTATFCVLLFACGLWGAAPARAVDHNNLDAGRPLLFDDAEALAYREQSLEAGLRFGWPRKRPLGLGLEAEYLYGFAPNWHVTAGIDPSVGGRAASHDAGFDFGDGSLGFFHQLNREYGETPAFALRGDVFFPTGRHSRGVDFRLRGIMSRQADQYGRLHLNLDLNVTPDAGSGERTVDPGLVLGYSRPLGYPRRFDRTGLAELAVRAGPERGAGPVLTAGIGLRQQVGVRSVLDVGIESDLAGFNGAPRDRIWLIAGYSYGF
jgi:hypothetical protein